MRGARARFARGLALATTLAVGAVGVAHAEVVQKGNLRVVFQGDIAPHKLPRQGKAPVAVTLAGQIGTVDGSVPSQLRTISLSINRNGLLDYRGLPRCNYHQIQPASTVEAIQACRKSLVGTGSFKADVLLPEQSPFPSAGRILAFNGNLHGHPVIYAHIYGTKPLPTSVILPFRITQGSGLGTSLVAQLPRVTSDWGSVRAVSLTLSRQFRYRGQRRSYLSAGCPAPAGFPGATFTFAAATFSFDDGATLRSTLTRNCGVRG